MSQIEPCTDKAKQAATFANRIPPGSEVKVAPEKIKADHAMKPRLATPNRVQLDLRLLRLRDYGKPGGIPTLIDAPHSGRTAMIADYHDGQSLVQTFLANGIGHVALTDWKSATADMKDLDIDSYLAAVIVAIDDLGGQVNCRPLSGRLAVCNARRAISPQNKLAGARRRAHRH